MPFQAWKCFSLLLLLIEFSDFYEVNFCNKKYKCNDTSNTVCELGHNCAMLRSCVKYEYHPFSKDNKRRLAELHNQYRNKVAMGTSLPNRNKTVLPSAADMKELVWDKELEFLAQCWANQCPTTTAACFKNSAGIQLGQLLKYSKREQFSFNMLLSVYWDIKHVAPSDIASYDLHPKARTHNFMNLMHANSDTFGCARSRFYHKGFNQTKFLLVCLYGPKLQVKQKVYTEGEPCSLCNSSCHETYKGLCKTKQKYSEWFHICKFSNRSSCTSIMEHPHGPGGKESSATVICKYDNIIVIMVFLWIASQVTKDLIIF